MLCKTGDTPSSRGWGTWDTPTDHPTVTLPTSEQIRTPNGKWRCEVLTGRALIYQDGKNMGVNGPGVYVYEGQLSIYNQWPEAPVTMIITQLS